LGVTGADAWNSIGSHMEFIAVSALGLIAAVWLVLRAWSAARDQVLRAQWSLFLAYCALLAGPASQVYSRVDTWQDLPSIARAIDHDSEGKSLILFAPDETTRAMIDMYARTNVDWVAGPIDPAAIARLKADTDSNPHSVIVVQIPGRSGPIARRPKGEPEPTWLKAAGLRVVRRYALPNGRRYALLEPIPGS
jgi:hypothetical protein